MTTTWFQSYKDEIQTYLSLMLNEKDIGRTVIYKAFEHSDFNEGTREQEFVYTDMTVRGIKVDAGAEVNLGPLWLGIKNYRSQASGAIQTGDFTYIFSVADFPDGFEPSTKDQIVDTGDMIKVIKGNNVFNVAFLIVGEGSTMT